jgi:excisionase family DNA binding protein
MTMDVQIIQTTPQELEDLISKLLEKHTEQIKESVKPKEKSEYLTQKEVGELLKISRSTVYLWTKSGKLKTYSIERKMYYKRKEVEAALIHIKNCQS